MDFVDSFGGESVTVAAAAFEKCGVEVVDVSGAKRSLSR
jgi:hypothetical protein